MRSEDVMVVWTPNREPFHRYDNRGKVVVTTVPQNPEDQQYPSSVGACDIGWKAKSEAQRLEELKELADHMIHNDGISRETINEAFSDIVGWRPI